MIGAYLAILAGVVVIAMLAVVLWISVSRLLWGLCWVCAAAARMADLGADWTALSVCDLADRLYERIPLVHK